MVPGIQHLIAALRNKDHSVLQHAERAARYANVMGRALGLKNGQLAALHNGGVLHDMGKLTVPQEILDKPAPLTVEEWGVVRSHPIEGHNQLAGSIEKPALDIVLYHHEWYDGRGYPDHVKGDAIPVLARIFSIADAFDAMTSDRPVRRAMSPEQAREEILMCSGTQFDPVLVEVFDTVFEQIIEERNSARQGKPQQVLVMRPSPVNSTLPTRLE
jgi:HD-GYP domain-containing protein (c-di-GMP phosphodiesterase class II)